MKDESSLEKLKEQYPIKKGSFVSYKHKYHTIVMATTDIQWISLWDEWRVGYFDAKVVISNNPANYPGRVFSGIKIGEINHKNLEIEVLKENITT